MANLGKVIYINEEDYSTLLSGGSITKGGTTYTYDSTALYVIKDVSAPEYAETAGYATNAGHATTASQDGSGNDIITTYSKKPLVIEVDDTDTSVPQGTYASITSALAAGRDVIVKVTYTEDAGQVLICKLANDDNTEGEYDFSTGGFADQIFWCYIDNSNSFRFNIIHAAQEKTLLYMSVSGTTPSFTDINDDSLTHAQVIALLQDNTKDVVIKYSYKLYTQNNFADTYWSYCSSSPEEHSLYGFDLYLDSNTLSLDIWGESYTVTAADITNWNDKANKLKNIVIVKSGTAPNSTYSLPSGTTAASISNYLINGTMVVCTLDDEIYYYDRTTGSSSSTVLHFKYTDTTADGVVEKDLAIAYSNNVVTLTTTTADLSSKVSKITSTDNAIARFDGTGGQIQNSSAKVTDDGDVSARNIIIHGSNTGNDTRIITSDSTNNIYAKIGNKIPLVANDTEVRSGSSVAGTINLGTSTIPWNNVHAKKFITKDGTSSQVVLGDGSLKAANELSQYEAYLQWGGKNFVGGYGVADACMIPNLGSNKFAYGNPSGVTVEYSRDGGTTWQDYGLTDSQKRGLFVNAHTLNIGKADTNNPATTDYKLRIIIHTKVFGLYTVLNKFAFYVTNTTGNNHSFVTIDGRTQSDKEADNDVWTTFVDSQNINGWSGWNIINYPTGITTHGNRLVQYGDLRFTFFITATPSGTTSSGLTIIRMMGYGGEGWTTPSNMAATGHLYAHDDEQNATFPARVTATSLAITNGTSSQFLKANGSVDSTVYAPLASPALTGTPTAPTAASGTNTTQIATTAFVQNAVSDKADKCLVVTITRSGTSPNYTYTANKTYTEIGNALTAGTTVVLSYNSVYYWFTAKGIGNTPDLIFSNTSVDLGDTIEVAGKFFTITTSSVTYWENILTDTQQTLISMGIDEEAKSGSSCYFNDASGNELTHAQVGALIEDNTKDVVISHYISEDAGTAYFRMNGYYANIKGGTKSLSNGAKAYFTGFAQGDSKWYNITLTWNNNAFTAECVAIGGGSGSGNIIIKFDPTTEPWEFYNDENDQITDSDVADILNNNPPSNIVFYNFDGNRIYYASEYGYYRTIDFTETHDLLDISVHPTRGLEYQLISEPTNTAPVIITATTSGGTDGIYTVAVSTYGDVTEALGYTKQPVVKFSLSEGVFFVPMYRTSGNAYIGSAMYNGYTIDVALNTLIKQAVVSPMASPIEVDTALSESSINPVQNRVITAQILENEEIVATALNNLNDRVELKQDQLVSGTTIKTINNQSILGSGNISISGGGGGSGEENVIEIVKVNGVALTPDANKAVNIPLDSIPTANSGNAVTSGGIKSALDGKATIATFNVTSTTSGGVTTYDWGTTKFSDITNAINNCDDVIIDYSDAKFHHALTLSDGGTIHAFGQSGGLFSPMVSYLLLGEGNNDSIETTLTSRGVVNADWDEISSSSDAYIKNKPNLSTVATTGSYEDLIDKPTIPTALSDLTDDSTHRVVTDTEKSTWNGKYTKPSGGIPKTDLATAVQTSLGKADSSVQDIQAKVGTGTATSIVNSSTKIATITLDTTPTSGSTNTVTSGGVYTAVNAKYTKPAAGIPDTDLTTAVNVRLLAQLSSSSDDGKIMKYSYSAGSWQAVKPVTIYSGSSAPSSSTGSNGDIYIQTS